MKTSATFSLLGLGATLASAHMEMLFPPPLRSKANTHATTVDSDMTSPLSQDGSNFPCKGFLSDLGTEAGASVTTFEPGQSYNFTISGGANHNGGSCQASLSYDKGKTFTVIHSYIGNCPLQGESSFDFKVPDDTPAGEAVFSWTWFNQIGNREMYQNCASVTIGGKSKKAKSKRAFSSRPAMFVANVGNGCGTTESKDLEFPEPGPDVSNDSTNTAPPTGSCAGGSGGGSGGGDNGGSDGGNTGGNDGGNTGGGSDGGNTGGGNESNPGIPDSSEPNPGIPSAPAGGASSSAPSSPQPTTAPVESEPSATIPGGVFITSPGAGDGPVAPPAPTTMLTLTNPGIPPPASTPGAVEPPAPVPTPPSTTPGNGGGSNPTPPSAPSGGAMPQGEACTNEGEWNCVGGSQFQRCASGQWSPLMAMAEGTSCQSGMGATLAMARKGKRSLRYARALRI
ncbi:extracellular protein [Sarocladium implicatum]|nr:extracellular protein [Sarocladium implicatum]